MAQRPLHRNVSNLKDKAVPVIRGLKESLNVCIYFNLFIIVYKKETTFFTIIKYYLK